MDRYQAESRVAVLVCIAEPFLRAGICACLTDQPGVDFFDAEPATLRSSVDVVIADSSTAVELAEEGRRLKLNPCLQFARILAITGQVREHAIRSAMEQGIRGFVLTSSPVSDLLEGIRTLFSGGFYLCPPVAQRLACFAERDMLTSREDEVLQLLAKGLCNKSIARDLCITVGTVKAHVRAIMAKLDAECRTQAASIATERGLVEIPEPSLRRVKPYTYAVA